MKYLTTFLKSCIFCLPLLYLTSACNQSADQKETNKVASSELRLGQHILDFYNKYSKGYYKALQSSLAPEVTRFLAATHATPAQIVNNIQAKNTLTSYLPDMTSIKINNGEVRLKVTKEIKEKNKEVVWAYIKFDNKQRIVSYRETPIAKKQVAESSVNLKKYNGTYRFDNENKTLLIKWDKGSKFNYVVSLTSPDCLGEFTGSGFFANQHTGVAGNGTECKITFDFSKPNAVTISETVGCRNAQTKACRFGGVYKLAEKSS